VRPSLNVPTLLSNAILSKGRYSAIAYICGGDVCVCMHVCDMCGVWYVWVWCVGVHGKEERRDTSEHVTWYCHMPLDHAMTGQFSSVSTHYTLILLVQQQSALTSSSITLYYSSFLEFFMLLPLFPCKSCYYAQIMLKLCSFHN